MADPQTPTPRCDAVAMLCNQQGEYYPAVPADFARTLERELSALQSALAEARRDAYVAGAMSMIVMVDKCRSIYDYVNLNVDMRQAIALSEGQIT